MEPSHWAQLFRLAGELDWAAAAVETTPELLREAYELLDARLRAWAASETSEQIIAQCQAEHIPAAPIRRSPEVVGDRHLAARELFQSDGEFRGVRPPWLTRVEEPSQEPAGGHAGDRVRPRGDLPLAGLRILDLTWAWAGPFATTLLRPHRSLSLDSPQGRSPVQRTPSQRVVSKPVLGGLHHEYRWAA